MFPNRVWDWKDTRVIEGKERPIWFSREPTSEDRFRRMVWEKDYDARKLTKK